MTTAENIKKLEQVKETLIGEYDDFCRDDVEYSLDANSKIDNINDQLWHDERMDRDKSFNDAISNIDEILHMLRNNRRTEKIFK